MKSRSTGSSSSPPVGVVVRHVTDIVGEWGRWQLNIALFSISISLFSSLNNLAVTFYAPKVDYWCGDDGATTSANNQSQSIDYCLTGCQNWTFDKSVFKRTIIDEWHLICDWRGMASLSESLYMLGFALGGVIFGGLSDRFGRIPILWASLILEIAAGLSSALAVNITHFMISRFILGMVCNGRYLTTFMLVTECVGPKHRASLGMYFQLGWALGYCLLPGIAYLLPNFRHLLLTTSLIELPWLVWLIFIPESLRWLTTHGRWTQAERVFKRAVQMNSLADDSGLLERQLEQLKMSTTDEEQQSSGGGGGQQKPKSKSNLTYIWEIMKSPNLRRTTLIMYFTWFVNAFVYYGISLNIGDFGGDLFINFLIAGLLEFPSIVFPVVAFKFVGRRPLSSALMYLSGLSCFGVLPFLSMTAIWPRVTVALIGKFFITSSFVVIYVYAAEVYPTVVRQVGVGSCSVAARVGSILAPFVKELNIYTGMSVVLSIYGGLSIADGVSIHFLPETRGQQIADTVEEAEQLNRRKRKNKNHNQIKNNDDDDANNDFKVYTCCIHKF
ncbi:organic cation transporter protein-like [Oppia nitens]|uniref:organic cation transporter protein-like n=1 Tax=Oppia nitens TaxID=1686743 RepID=UPI0023DBBB24|nr:organic cation transporter protein-like [Oppia nitens]